MEISFNENGKISFVDLGYSRILYTEKQGFYIGNNDIVLNIEDNFYIGEYGDVSFKLNYGIKETYFEINIEIKNNGTEDITEDIGFHTGIDSYMTEYPQWHEPLFPTLLRCEKTHIWGYYMNTSQNSLAFASEDAVASYDINYNRNGDEDYGHRVCGSDIVFIKNARLPERHPENLSVLKAGETYKNKFYFIPVEKKENIILKLSQVANLPMIRADKYTYEKGEKLHFDIFCNNPYKVELVLPDSKISDPKDFVVQDYGLYNLKVYSSDGKISEALFCCRKDWDFYLYNAAKEALNKPQKASTHVEGFYGLFSMFLSMKYFDDKYLAKKAYECFYEIMGLMFDFKECKPIIIPWRIQNTALLISLLTDIYEADPDNNLKFLDYAVKFADWLIKTQDDEGVYRNRGVHYTCVIYIAKALLELTFAEKNCREKSISDKYNEHYLSVKRAIDELVRNLDNIQTEGEMTLEDGMISCSALQIAMFALTLPEKDRAKYINAAEYMISIHCCLEQQLVPDCRMNGCSLRYWESQYDVMIRNNMINSPHGWSGWTGYAHYYLYMLTGKKMYLLSLMNLLGSCAQLMSFEGNLRWAFCPQPYVKAKTLVPDLERESVDGYSFVDSKEKCYRGKYEIREFGEEYIDMISNWYRVGKQKVMGGYEFCPLFLDGDKYINVDNQGGCCDNDVHEIFKCIEECVFRKAFIYENDDGSYLTYGCKVTVLDNILTIHLNENVSKVIYNLKNEYEIRIDSKSKINNIEFITMHNRR